MAVDTAGLLARARTEMFRFAAIYAYLFLIFGLFQLHSFVVLKEHDLPYLSWGFALVNTMMLGKLILVAESLELGRRLARDRLIIAVFVRALLFALLFLLVDSLEKALVAKVTSGVVTRLFPVTDQSFLQSLLLTAILAVALVPFFLFSEIGRKLGAGRMRALLLGPLASSDRERAHPPA